MTMHIDNYDPETYLWLLQKMDVPFIKEEWNTLRDRAYAKNPHTMNGMSVFGKYLSKMKLKQWQDYTWEDSEKLQAEKDLKMKHAQDIGEITPAGELKRLFEEGKITEAEFLTLSEESDAKPPAASGFYPTNNPGFEEIDFIDIAAELTPEDKMELAMKWGRLYTPTQWVMLEKMYVEYVESFDVQGADRESTLKMICKTSLKMDEAIDCNDIETYLKLSRVYEPLRKSGKFTEAQNKEGNKDLIDSVGELVALCEKEGGFIPRLETEFDQDIIDKTIQDMNKYTYNLVTKDMGLDEQIQNHLKKMELQAQMEETEEEQLNEDLSIEDIEQSVLDDVDFQDFYEEIESQKADDENGA